MALPLILILISSGHTAGSPPNGLQCQIDAMIHAIETQPSIDEAARAALLAQVLGHPLTEAQREVLKDIDQLLFMQKYSRLREQFSTQDARAILGSGLTGSRPGPRFPLDEIDKIVRDLNLPPGDPHWLEADVAASVLESAPHQFVGFRKVVPHPNHPSILDKNLGIDIPLQFEIDIELKCCIVEVTTMRGMILDKQDPGGRFIGKRRQLRRYLNADGNSEFLNPEKKQVVLFAPEMYGAEVPNAEALGVKVFRNKEEFLKFLQEQSASR
ncbi:MAG: hypothetical protein AB7P04_01135 [Bacteriovoracia bacterium]